MSAAGSRRGLSGSRRGVLLAAAALAVTAAACSSGSSSPTTSTTTRPSASSTSSTRPGPTTTSSGSTSSSSAPPGTVRCPTADLAGSVVGQGGAAGTIQLTVGLRTSSPSPCILGGYPGLQLLGPGASALPTNVVRGGSYSFTNLPTTTVTLATGQSADFNLGYSDVPTGSETSCPTASSMEVTPPNATDHLVMSVTLAPCGGGTVVVSPVFAAGTETQTTAPPG